MSAPPPPTITPDSQHRSLAERLPQPLRDYALLARFDRPVGWWLLFWPCAAGVWLAGAGPQWALVGWLLLGSIAMRGAGCVFNDIVDADLDRQVERTAARPVASGRVSRIGAAAWLIVLALVGLVVLLQLPRPGAQWVALAVLLPVAAYPFMKRITWWPQVWLGLVFNWGALVGWLALRDTPYLAVLTLYAGCALWCVGYDTIYALQDREDDALIGVRSSALRLGSRVRTGVALFYAGALGLWALAIWLLRDDLLAPVALLPVALHLGWQVATLEERAPANPLRRFRSNAMAGALLAAACFVVGNA